MRPSWKLISLNKLMFVGSPLWKRFSKQKYTLDSTFFKAKFLYVIQNWKTVEARTKNARSCPLKINMNFTVKTRLLRLIFNMFNPIRFTLLLCLHSSHMFGWKPAIWSRRQYNKSRVETLPSTIFYFSVIRSNAQRQKSMIKKWLIHHKKGVTILLGKQIHSNE